MKTVAKTLDVARSHLHERLRRPTTARGGYAKQGDEVFLPLIRRLVDERPTYGYRRITALVNRELAAEAKPAANHKRVFRIMKRHGLLLARHTGRRNGRLHDGKVVVMRSNLRWCSLNWPPFRPDTRHNLEGLRLSSSTGLCLTTTNVSN